MTTFIAFSILSVMTCLVIASISGLLNYIIYEQENYRFLVRMTRMFLFIASVWASIAAYMFINNTLGDFLW